MNSNVDSTYSLELTGTSAEKSVARKPKKQRKRFLWLVGAVAFIALPLLAIHLRFSRTQAVQAASHDPKMEVSVVHPAKVSTTTSVELPGQTQAYTDAPIFAQTSGYLKAWYFDIGAKVKAGDVLAEIDTPEVDQELAQAQAQLKVAQSALDLSQATFQREQNLFKRKIIAAEDFDTAADTNHENQATVIADQANVNQLEALEAFKTIKAPFDGVGYPALSRSAHLAVARVHQRTPSRRAAGKTRRRRRPQSEWISRPHISRKGDQYRGRDRSSIARTAG
jgi:multidrug efflux pump subunit AcrA (membrane-fusion protein)